MDLNAKNTFEILMTLNNKTKDLVTTCASIFTSIKWKHVSFVIPTAPEPSHRPRLCGYRVYVPGAAKHAAYFNKFILPKLNGLFIDTPCKMKIDFYMETPKSFTKTQKCLAEMRILRPWMNIGDVDNLCKTTMDMIQPNEKRGHVGIMENDCLVLEIHASKYYSMTARTEVNIQYMDRIPDTVKKIFKLQRDESSPK